METEVIVPLVINALAWPVISWAAGWAAWHKLWFLFWTDLVLAAAAGTYVTAVLVGDGQKPPAYIAWPVAAVQLTAALVVMGRAWAQRRSR